MSPTVKLFGLLLILQLSNCCGKKKVQNNFKLTVDFQPYKGKLPSNGVVRIIEYILPAKHIKSKPKSTKKPNTKKCKRKKPCRKKQIQLRSISPNPTNFLIKVLENKQIICSGSLITTKLALSSSNCFSRNPSPSQFQLQDINKGLHSVDQIVLSSSYDLAALLLTNHIKDSSIQTLKLCQQTIEAKQNVSLYMTKVRSNFLRTQIVENAVCKQSFMQNEFVFITSNMFCAQNSNVAADCEKTLKGDPLLHNGQLCGINVYGPSCNENAPNGDLYANIFKARDFIEDVKRKVAET
ncbi:hypothetical protein KR215_001300 [Drosophila sulfurigaster]|nr:hypothetical protein KR215_001300 [Drosophila sulfurigaster]